MSATGEGEAMGVELPTAEVPATEKSQSTEKPVKEKKSKAPKEKKPKPPKTSSHPPYFQMIKDALLALNEKSGSSPYAIAKYMEEKHKAVLPVNFKKILALQLKNSAVKGKLIKIKASYKLSESGKKVTAKDAKADVAKKPKQVKAKPASGTAPKAKASKNSETKKKAAKPVKKVGVKKTKPRSIKSPAAKKAKKATAA